MTLSQNEIDSLMLHCVGSGIRKEHIEKFKKKLKVGDSVIVSEPGLWDATYKKQVRYKITELHPHVFTAVRNSHGIPFTISMSYVKLMTQGYTALARSF